MNALDNSLLDLGRLSERLPLNVSRRGFLGGTLGALVLGIAMPAKLARAAGEQASDFEPGTRVPAFLKIAPDGSVTLQSPFIEGGQGIFTALAQIVGEELDANPATFTVVCAPPGADYAVMGGSRLTGGSFSVRSSYITMRGLGAAARQMLLEAAAARLDVPVGELTTEPGKVIHAASGRSLAYGDVAAEAAELAVPENAPLKADADFRWIRQPMARLDTRDKSTGKAQYAIDLKVDGMLHAAVQHAPRLGQEPGDIANQADVEAMPGVHSVHKLPGRVAVVAERWWRARSAVESLDVNWTDPAADAPGAMPADYSSAALLERLNASSGPSFDVENEGDASGALGSAAKVVEARYDAPFLAHGQLEPPSTIAKWNEDGTLELWVPNQQPEVFQAVAAGIAGIAPPQVTVHSPILGGFFGRHFMYGPANPLPQAIMLTKAVGRPVKVIWSREEEFLRDALRPMGVARLKAGLDAEGMPVALEAEAVGEGPLGRLVLRNSGQAADPTAVEGMAHKPYGIPNRRVAHVYEPLKAQIGFWRSVGHSMNDFFYETFFDEMADAGGQDPYELRLKLLADSPRHKALLEAVGELSGGWKRGPFEVDGSRRARGAAMASPFNTEVATIAEVSIENGEVVVHDVWVAIDPGSIVNPAIIEAQVNSAVALGLSSALLEEVVYTDGMPEARNFDLYPILPPEKMPRVHVRIIESGEPMGGIGEPGLPGVPPAVVNAASVLTGKRIRSLPLSKADLGSTG